MSELVVATLLWDANDVSFKFSRMYDESWALKVFNGFERNLSAPFRKVLYTDRERDLPEDVEQFVVPGLGLGGYGDCIKPYELNEPMILCGLDTVVTGNCDHLAAYCKDGTVIGLPRDPYRLEQACNGVALVPGGMRHIADDHRGENDMDWMRAHPHLFLDDAFPGQIKSYKGHVRQHGLGDVRICYFHGDEKPHQLAHLPWIHEHWR